MTVEERLSSIDGNLVALNQRLTDHTDQDDNNFSKMNEQLSDLDEKLDQLLIREGRYMGVVIGLSSSIAIVVSVMGLAVTFFVNG